MADRPFFIIDGHALLYRAFYALPNLTSPDGRPTGAILGFLRKTIKIMREVKPRGLAVIFDGPGPSFRKEMYDQYKAQRSPMPEDLAAQIPILLSLLKELGLPTLMPGGVEADDVIATLALAASAAGADVEILSGDKDLAALVRSAAPPSGSVSLLAPGRELDREKRLEPDGVKEKYGVSPALIPELLSLMGDSSDNIPGLAGVGPKTAVKLLEEFGSIENLLAAPERLPAKVKKALDASPESLAISRRLVAMKTDLDLGLGEDPVAAFPKDLATTPKAVEILTELGMKSLINELDLPGEPAPAAVSSLLIPPVRILDQDSLGSWLERFVNASITAIDTETTGLTPRNADLVGVSFAAEGMEPAYLPFAHAGQERSSAVVDLLGRFLADAGAMKCGHNLKYDIQILRGAGFECRGFVFDTLVASALLDPGRRSHSLDALALDYWNHVTIKFADLGGPFAEVPLDRAATYAGQDAFLTLGFHDRLAPRLSADPALQKLYREIEHPLIEVLAAMEWAGVHVDATVLAGLAEEFSGELEVLRFRAHAEAGAEFNLDSPKQVGAILFERLGLPHARKTKTGFSTDQKTLEELAHLHPLPGMILEHREIAKLLGTYVEALPALISARTGRLHTSFSQTRTATGRLASSEPNLQNIPIRSARGREIRRAFTAPPGRVLVSADYSQVEFRIVAWMAQEEELLGLLAEGADLHAATARRLFNREPGAEDRRRAKAVNFGILYGQSAFGLARSLGIGRIEAERIIKDYYAAFPRLKAWMDATLEKARATGLIETLFGRRRPIPEINAANGNIRQAAERIAINSPVQGTAADVIKIAMLRLRERLATSEGSDIVLQVHDELLVETGEESAETVEEAMRRAMKEIPLLGDLLEVNIGRGRNWLEAGH
jgi:DNA polymerase-1